MPRGAAVHYLRGNAQSGQSRRHVIIDTEARWTYADGIQTQSWLCGVAGYIDRDSRRKTPSRETTDYDDPTAMWHDIGEFTRSNARTIVWAHNLAYDLRISRALELLPESGWELQAIALDGISCWGKFTRDDHTLVLADFTSWAMVPLSRIGDWLGVPTKPRPTDPFNVAQALDRCRGDVQTLGAAVEFTLDWLQREDLGNLQITGAGQGFTAFRHKHLTHKILVHDDADARRAERRAIWTGRTEAWHHGTINNITTYEYDLQRAYATIARDVTLPTVYVGKLSTISLADLGRFSRTRRLLCNCVIETPRPIVPTSNDGRILWPVGHFQSTLWDCEIHALLAGGANVRIGESYVYTSEPCLRDWALWILGRLDAQRGTDHPLEQRILKSWSRSLIGRFALQYRSWLPLGTTEESNLILCRMIGEGEKKNAQLLHVGNNLFELGDMAEGENSLPQLTGYITAMCRVRLWELMNTAGLDHVYYVDTDSIITDRVGADRLESRIQSDGAYGLALKREIRHLELNGPRQLAVDGDRRHAGVPRAAHATGSDTVSGDVWEGLSEALRSGHGTAVRVYERTFNLSGQDRRREWLPSGGTRAITLTADDTPAN